jgi:hypothetical protein
MKVEVLNLGDPRVPVGDGDVLYASVGWNRAFAGRDGASYAVVARDRSGVRGTMLVHDLPHGSSNTVYDTGTLLSAVSPLASPGAPQVLLGARNGQWNGYHLVDSNAEARLETLSALVSEGRGLGHGTVGFLYADIEQASEMRRAVPDLYPLLTDANSTVPVLGATLERHIEALPARPRADARRDLRQSHGLPRFRSIAADDSFDVWADLVAQTQAHHGQPADTSRLMGYLTACVRGASEAVVFWYGDDEPVAFCLALVHAGTLWVRLVGLTYGEDGSTQGRYPGVLVHGPVAYAAERGLRAVDLGAGLADFKRRRGATTQSRWSLLAPTHPVDADAVVAHNRREFERLGLNPQEQP